MAAPDFNIDNGMSGANDLRHPSMDLLNINNGGGGMDDVDKLLQAFQPGALPILVVATMLPPITCSA